MRDPFSGPVKDLTLGFRWPEATKNEISATTIRELRPDQRKQTVNYLSTVVRYILVASLPLALTAASWAQAQPEQAQDSGTSTDLWIMPGSDFDRPGLTAKANYNIGIGHTFAFLKKDPIGDEITFGYTYEDAGPGFWHSQFGSDTESLGIMKNFGLPKTKWVTGYTWIQLGITSFTGNAHVQNNLYDGESLGAILHFSKHNSIWIQETFNKVVTVPWYTTTSIGYTWSW
jgi:hypothetical protein